MIDELEWNVEWDEEMQKLWSCWTLKDLLELNEMYDGVVILILACMIEELVLERVMYKIVQSLGP